MSFFNDLHSTTMPLPLHRKFSEESGTCLPSAGKSNSLLIPKPCLKRRCSTGSAATHSAAGLRRCHGSCDSFDDLDSGSSCTSCSSSGDSESMAGSFSSRKSVCFADSVGEDLCRIKTFKKELFELEESYFHEEPWTARMWRWQVAPFVDDLDEGLDEWCLSEDTLEAIDERLEEDYDEDGLYMEVAAATTIETSCTSDEGSELARALSPLQLEEIAGAAVAASVDRSNTVVVPTFLCPKDLPEYPAHLAEWGVSLEGVTVDGDVVRGSVEVAPGRNATAVTILASFDEWNTVVEFAAARDEDEEDKWVFALDVSRMETGDDLEISVVAKTAEVNVALEDDNLGSKYRFIRKNKPKFRPGKSLW